LIKVTSAVLLPAWLLAALSSAADQPGLVKSEFIYETASFPSCHASTIVETKAGLVAAWFGGTAERNPDVCIYVSRQENGKWTAPAEVANGVGFGDKRLPTWNPVLFQPRTGPLMLFYKVGPSPSTWWGMLTTSTDAGKTWAAPRRLPDGILGPIKNKPVQLANGDILSGTSTEGSDGWRVHFERSTDGGQTWTATAPMNDGKEIAAIQPSILFHGKNKLQAIGRTKQNRLFEISSSDGGKKWGRMKLTEMPNPNSGTDAVTLQDGRQLLVYNHNPNYKGRSPLNVAISKDGKDWLAALVLEDEPGASNGFSYPAVIQTSDGLVHITYTWRREKIKHAVVDLGKLELSPMTDSVLLWPK
jgi:predicted neuraminidase